MYTCKNSRTPERIFIKFVIREYYWKLKIAVFWIVLQYRVVDITDVSGEAYCLHIEGLEVKLSVLCSSLKMGTAPFSETLDSLHQIARWRIPEDRNVKTVIPAIRASYLQIIKNFPHISIMGKIG